MPLPEGTDPAYEAFYGSFVQAAASRLGIAETYRLFADAWTAAGREGSPDPISVAKLYGAAQADITATEALQGAVDITGRRGVEQSIDASMIGFAPFSPSEADWATSPSVLVRYEYERPAAQGGGRAWLSFSIDAPPETTGDLLAAVGDAWDAAQEAEADGGSAIEGELTGSVMIHAI